jgi:hypothetical protein
MQLKFYLHTQKLCVDEKFFLSDVLSLFLIKIKAFASFLQQFSSICCNFLQTRLKRSVDTKMVNNFCEFCKKTFATKGNLSTHQSTAKYCLALQNKLPLTKHRCEYCYKDFVARCLEAHMKICTLKKDHNISMLKDENESLRLEIVELKAVNRVLERSHKCVEEIAKQPKTLNKNITNNKVSILTPLDLSHQRLKELVEANFTDSHLLEGQKGVARFTLEHVIKDEDGKLQYICTDPARHTFRFKEGDTEIKDIRGKRLSTALVPPVMDKTGRLGMQAIKENPELFCVYSDSQQSIRDMRDDDAEFRGELASMVT